MSLMRSEMEHVNNRFEGQTGQALRGVLKSWGFDAEDFEIDANDEFGLATLLAVDGGIIAVRCVKTGVERLYATGPDSAWFGAFFMDLGWGCFAKQSSPERWIRGRPLAERTAASLHPIRTAPHINAVLAAE